MDQLATKKALREAGSGAEHDASASAAPANAAEALAAVLANAAAKRRGDREDAPTSSEAAEEALTESVWRERSASWFGALAPPDPTPSAPAEELPLTSECPSELERERAAIAAAFETGRLTHQREAELADHRANNKRAKMRRVLEAAAKLRGDMPDVLPGMGVLNSLALQVQRYVIAEREADEESKPAPAPSFGAEPDDESDPRPRRERRESARAAGEAWDPSGEHAAPVPTETEPTKRAVELERLRELRAANELGEVPQKPNTDRSWWRRRDRNERRRFHRKWKRQRDEASEQKKLAADQRWRERFLADCAAWGWDTTSEPPPCIPSDVWVMCWAIVGDATGKMGRSWMRWFRSRLGGGPWLLSKIVDAAFVPKADGSHTYTWIDLRARRIVAIGLLLARMALPCTRQKAFGGTSRRSGMVVKGVSRSALASAVALPQDRDNTRPCYDTIGSRTPKWTGYVAALEDSGFLSRAQLPASQVAPFEIGRCTGHVINRYWLTSPVHNAQPGGRGRPMQYGSVTVDDDYMSRCDRGWHFCDQDLTRSLRGSALREAQIELGIMVRMFELVRDTANDVEAQAPP